MAWDKDWDRNKDKDNDKECNCCLEINKSLVVIICGEIDIDRFKDTLTAVIDNARKE